MTLLDWKPKGWSVLAEVRIILRDAGFSNLSEECCRGWARDFIKKYLPDWEPGNEFTWKEAQIIGEAFDELLVQCDEPVPRLEALHKAKKRRR